MTVSLWRIGATKGKYTADDLSGNGAAAVGGRFNPPGTAVVYAASSVSLAVLETLVHFGVDAHTHANRFLIEIAVPDDVFQARTRIDLVSMKRLCPFWGAIPFAEVSQKVGGDWVLGAASLLLEVPSSILPHADIPDVNYLINPRHPDTRTLEIVRRDPFHYDARF